MIPLVNDSGRPTGIGVQILHGCLHVLVPHQLFDLGQVHALNEHVGGKGVAGAIEFEVRGDRRQFLLGGGEVDGLDGRGPLFSEGGEVPAFRPFRWKHPRVVAELAQAQQFSNAVAERYVAFDLKLFP